MRAKFKYYITERHGYVQTSVAYLRKLKISKLISPYSRQLGTKVFIEEDGDLRLFLKRHRVNDTEVTLEEDFSYPQEHFDNMFNYKDDECQDEQFDGFKTDWTLNFECIFSKADNIKHVRDGIFQTKDGKQIKIYPTVYVDGKPLKAHQAKKLGFEPIAINTKDLEEYYD
jgi:hypothetical protein